MIDWTKPVQTRDGRAVRVLCTDAGGDYPVVALVAERACPEQDFPRVFTKDGMYRDYGSSSNLYLVNVPERTEVWVNVYPVGSLSQYESRSAADFAGTHIRIALIRISHLNGTDVRAEVIDLTKGDAA